MYYYKKAAPYYQNFGNMENTDKTTVNQKEVFLLAVDILESKDNFELWVALPGAEKTDFHIELENEELRIWAERKSPDTNGELKFVRQETRYGFFERRFKLGKGLDTDNITAAYQQGILKISIPKTGIVSKIIPVA